jgi:riboflavin kinase/FMN adenylyltransferase
MQTHTTHFNLPESARHAVVAIGNFDGVHRGHAKVIAQAKQLAVDLNAPLAVLSFEPHPRTLFRPADPPFRLTSPAHKAQLLAGLGVDLLYVLPFSRELSLTSAAAFETAILHEGLGIRGAVVGSNFRYGQNRTGTFPSLQAAGERYGFIVQEAPAFRDERGEVISSTRIRQALADGRPAEAAQLLGRAWSIEAVVERGDQRGRQLGYPTANGLLGALLRPAYGIYAVRARLAGEAATLTGVASIGIRPMWETPEPLIETHLFDFDRDIYGRHLTVELIKYLRPEAKFDGIESLVAQIERDCEEAQLILNSPLKLF